MKSYIVYYKDILAESLDDAEDISHMEPQHNTQYGSNPGGIHHDKATGKSHYVKFYRDPEQAKTEVAASKIYGHMGVPHLNPKLVKHGEKLGVSTEWRTDLKRHTPEQLNSPPEHLHPQLAKHFHAAVLTKNWDAIGLEHDNVMSDKVGNLHTVDLGGSLQHRAMGGHKEYGHDIGEHDSLMSRGKPSGDVFSNLSHETLKHAAHSLNNVTDDHIDNAVKGMRDSHKIGTAMKARRDLIKSHYKI